jgi:putative flippase GtrA
MSTRPDSHLVRALELVKSPQFARFFRYSMVSAISSGVSLVGLYVFYRVFKIGSAGVSNICATAVATVPSYYLNRTWAWKRAGKSHLMREVVPFWVIAAVSLGLSTGAVTLASHEALSHGLQGRTETLLVEFANFFTYGVLWIGKFFFFNRFLFAHRPQQDEDEDSPQASDGIGAVEALAP